ncbi:MAG: 3-isopropylmalate dehydratase [Candidatus Anstonellales archaeon]
MINISRAWKFDDNINTDLITPGRYNLVSTRSELGKIAFIEYRPEFSAQVKKGDFIVAGRNFGCGSSRESAVYAIIESGIQAVIAKSYARIFYRNAINNGLLLIIGTSTFIDSTKDGDELILDGKKLRNLTRHTELEITIPPLMEKIRKYGGIIEFLKKNKIDDLERD